LASVHARRPPLVPTAKLPLGAMLVNLQRYGVAAGACASPVTQRSGEGGSRRTRRAGTAEAPGAGASRCHSRLRKLPDQTQGARRR
jgi:hypothetical protein